MAKAIKSTKAKKSSKPNPQRMHVIEACATAGCFEPPLKNSGHCAVHSRMTKADAKKVQKQLAALIDDAAALVRPDLKKSKKADSPPPPVRKSVSEKREIAIPKPTKAQRPSYEARAIIAGLLGRGWTQSTIANAMSTSPGRVWFWAHGKTCSRMEELRSLQHLDVPAREKKAKTVSGSRRAPTETAARVNAKLDDPRQLRLALEGLVGTISALLK